ncbi:MAG: glycosyltransferase family 39 protein [Chloroflexota bacterium]|nr:MAG: glycosyltransferase family 39 protein [Chloroflexota bacterium]
MSILLILLAFFVRLHVLAGDSFWIVEIITVKDASKGLAAVHSVRDHPPLLYIVTYGILQQIGNNEFLVRLPSLIAGVLAIPTMIAFGRILGWPMVGFWAAFLLALAPVHLRFSQMARHYALLMLFSLASYLFLYLALSRPSAKHWAAYAIAVSLNLYTHYGAFLVVASQAVFIAIWMAIQLARRRRLLLVYPIAAAVAVAVLFLPISAKIEQAFSRNVGDTSVRGFYTGVAPVTQWLNAAYSDFGFRADPLPVLFAGLAAAGFLILLRRRAFLLAVLSLAALVLPFALIALLQTARIPNIRYIIHMLPMYLILSAVAIDAILKWLSELRPSSGQGIYVAGSLIVGALLILLTAPLLQSEYEQQFQDWRGMANHLDDQAQDGAIVLGLSPTTVGFNMVTTSLPYYLNRTTKSFQYMSGHKRVSAILDGSERVDDDVWAAVWLSGFVAEEGVGDSGVSRFSNGLFLLHPQEQEDAVQALVALYERIVPMAIFPVPGCRMARDLVSFYVSAGDQDKIMDQIADLSEKCPDSSAIGDHNAEEFAQLLRQLVDRGVTDEARLLAAELLKYDHKHELSLEVMTHVDLLESFSVGDVTISQNEAPEPVESRTFTMPHNGDWGEVILTHPPASVSFELALPDEPVELLTRVALDPQSWPWGGDGVTFLVTIQEKGRPVVELFRQHVANDESDHDWLPVQVSLANYAGKEITLMLAAEDGPAGDGVGDWGGWESPRLFWEGNYSK